MREKQLKVGSRQKKIVLINQTNKEWRDLYGELQGLLRFARNDKKGSDVSLIT